MKSFIISFLLILCSACSMSPAELAIEQQKLNMIAAVAAQPTLTCTDGCTYNDPKRNLQLFQKETNGWDFANKILDTTVAVTPWVAVANIAVKGINNAGGNTSNTDSYNQHSEANQANNYTESNQANVSSVTTTSTNTSEISGSYNNESNANPVTSTSNNSTDNSNTDSGNSTVTSTEVAETEQDND